MPAPHTDATKATARPWRIERSPRPVDGEFDCGIFASVSPTHPIAETFGRISENVRASAEANATLIVTAVNSYDAMREALKMIAGQTLTSEMDDDQREHADVPVGYDACIEIARAALSPRATGGAER